MHKIALIVIDMLNDYLTPEGLIYCSGCRSIIDNIRNCIQFARTNEILVIYANTALHDKRDILVKKWGLHAVEGTKGAEVIQELQPITGDLVVKKKCYNAFHQTDLHRCLQEAGVSRVAITGIHTHVCVLLTAAGAFEHGYEVTTLEDCITSGYLPNHENRLRFFKTHIGELMTADDWMKKVLS